MATPPTTSQAERSWVWTALTLAIQTDGPAPTATSWSALLDLAVQYGAHGGVSRQELEAMGNLTLRQIAERGLA